MARPRYRSVVAQTLHYLSRPHSGVRRAPLDVPAAWRGAELAAHPERWRERLSGEEVAELDRAQRRAAATGKPTGELVAADFPLPTLAARIEAWRRELAIDGRGFLVLSGVPVERWSEEESERFFWCLGLHLGVPGAQSGEGDLLGHVRDRGYGRDDGGVRAYRTSAEIPFHCDAADVVGLLCLTNSATGGESRIASSVTVMNELLERAPRLVERLYAPFALDTRGDGGVSWVAVPPCRYHDGRLRSFYHGDYFRSAMRHADAPRLRSEELELLQVYEEIASSPEVQLAMRLEPGDVQLLSNHTVVHGRGGYDDPPDDAGRRHLLRLWLSLPASRSIGERARVERERLRVLGALLRARLRGGAPA